MTLDAFAQDILNRCCIVRSVGHYGSAWSISVQLAVALVLRDQGYFQDLEYSEFEAKRHTAAGIGCSIVEVDAWLDAIRAELD